MLGLEFEVYDDVPDHINVYMFAKFFDKFNLRVGKTALLVEFPYARLDFTMRYLLMYRADQFQAG